MFNIINNNRAILLNSFYVLIAFIIIKAITFVTPIKVYDLLGSKQEYGYFEYILNVGQTLTGFLSVGMVGSYAYFVTKNKRKNLSPIFHNHFVVVSTILLLLSFLYLPILDNLIFKGLVLGNVMANQVFISSYLKLKGKNILAIIMDAGIYLIMAVFVCISFFFQNEFSQRSWFLSIIIYTFLIIIFFHFPKTNKQSLLKFNDLKEVYKFGGFVMISGPLLVLVTANTRLYLEYFIGPEAVAVYSIVFRIVSLVLIVSRVSTILMFRRMFIDDHNNLDKNYSIILFGVFILTIITYLVLPIVLDYFNLDYLDQIKQNYLLYKWCFIQVTVWIAVSIMEILFQRENIVHDFLSIIIITLLLMIVVFGIFNYLNMLSILNIVIINVVALTVLFSLQVLVLRDKVFYYKKTFITTLSICLILLII